MTSPRVKQQPAVTTIPTATWPTRLGPLDHEQDHVGKSTAVNDITSAAVSLTAFPMNELGT